MSVFNAGTAPKLPHPHHSGDKVGSLKRSGTNIDLTRCELKLFSLDGVGGSDICPGWEEAFMVKPLALSHHSLVLYVPILS